MVDSKAIFIASSPEDVQFFLDSKNLNDKNTTVIATSLDAYNKLEANHIRFETIHHLINAQSLKANYKETDFVVKNILEDRIIKEIFSYDGLDLFELLSYDLYFFLNRILLGYDTYLKTPKLQKISKVWIPKSAVNKYLYDVINNDFMPFVLENIFKKNAVKAFDFEPKNLSAASNNFLKTSIKLTSQALFLRKSTLPKNAAVLFLCPGSHSLLLIKVFKELKKRKIKYLLVAHNLAAIDRIKLKKNGVTFVDRPSLQTKDIKKNAAFAANLITKRWKGKKRNIKLNLKKNSKNRFLYRSILLRVEWFLKNELSSVLTDYFTAIYLFGNINPKALVTTTDPNIKVLPFIKIAQKNKIKTVTLQHGMYVWPPGANFKSDKMLVWGNYYLNWFIKHLNKDKACMSISGSAFFDNIRLENVKSKSSVKSVLILMALPSVFLLQFRTEFEKLINKLANLGVKKFYVRSHPWQDISGLMAIRNNKLILTRANKKSLDHYIHESDVVITMSTTAGFNTLFAGKPLIYWDFAGDRNAPFATAGVPAVRTAKAACKFIEKYQKNNYLLSDSNRRFFLKQVFFKLDGLSSLRIADKIAGEYKN